VQTTSKLGNSFPEPTAQGTAWLRYYLGPDGRFWEKLGNEILTDKPATGRDSGFAVVRRVATGRETDAGKIHLEGIRLGTARIPIRPIMRAAGVAKASQVTKGRYRLGIFASSADGGLFDLLVNGVSKEFTVKGDALLELDVDLPANANLQAECTLRSGDVVLSGLSLDPID